MTQFEKNFWRVFFYAALTFCTVMFSASCAGSYESAAMMFFGLCMVLLVAVDKLP